MPTIAQIEAELGERSLRDFVQLAWHTIEPNTPYIHNWHIDAICDHLEAVYRREIKRLIINMPPRSMKSLAVSVFFPAWAWIHNPSLRWLFASYAQTLSTRDSVRCRDVITSQWYRERWGNRYELKWDQNVKTYYYTDKGGWRIATSVGGSATGEGGDIIIVDDPHNIKEAESDQQRENVILWWDRVMSTRLNDPRNGAMVVVMQRVHEKDLTGHLLEQGGWELLCLPMEYDGRRIVTSIGWSDPRQKEGELLWPERISREIVDRLKKTMGSYAASAQLQQRPTPAGGGLIKAEWFKYYDEPPDKLDTVIVSWDMAFKEADDSSYVVGQVWGYKRPNYYLLYQVRRHMGFIDTLREVRRLAEEWKPNAILIEDKANGPAVIEVIKREVSGVIPITPKSSKASRLSAVSPLFEAGNVYLPSNADWIEDYKSELLNFPRALHDDQVDATTQALLWLTSRSRTGRLKMDLAAVNAILSSEGWNV